MLITVITLFPDSLSPILNCSIMKRSQDKGLVKFKLVNLFDFGIGLRKQVDDKPYGGGAGMVFRVDVVDKAINASRVKNLTEKVILLDPKGQVYKQKIAKDLVSFEHIILLCAHYEGIDERIKNLVDMELSIGDFILTGGEIPALAVIDSIVRLIPGVLGKINSPLEESFSESDNLTLLEHPQYTRPEEYAGQKVPQILLNGDHNKIRQYRKEESTRVTREKRPDLLIST